LRATRRNREILLEYKTALHSIRNERANGLRFSRSAGASEASGGAVSWKRLLGGFYKQDSTDCKMSVLKIVYPANSN